VPSDAVSNRIFDERLEDEGGNRTIERTRINLNIKP